MGKSVSKQQKMKAPEVKPELPKEYHDEVKLILAKHEETMQEYSKDLDANFGEKLYLDSQEKWRKNEGEFSKAQPVKEDDIDDIIKGIIKTTSGKTYDLPTTLKLSEMILICEEIWEAA